MRRARAATSVSSRSAPVRKGVSATTRRATSPAAGGAGESALFLGQRRSGLGPHLREGARHLGHRGSSQLDAGVAPGIDPSAGVADPHPSHAQAAHEGHAVVDHDRLAMIATQPGEGVGEPGRVEAAHLDTRRAQRSPEPFRGLAETTHPVVEEPHADTLARLGRERLRELPSRGVFVDDVALEQDPLSAPSGSPPARPGSSRPRPSAGGRRCPGRARPPPSGRRPGRRAATLPRP